MPKKERSQGSFSPLEESPRHEGEETDQQKKYDNEQ